VKCVLRDDGAEGGMGMVEDDEGWFGSWQWERISYLGSRSRASNDEVNFSSTT